MRSMHQGRVSMVMSGIVAFALVLMLSGCDKTVAPVLDNPYDPESASYEAFPSLTTRVVTQVSSTQAESGGSFDTDYGSDVQSKGVCWAEQGSASGLPVVGGNCTDEGGGFDAFVSVMTGLAPGVSYVVRSYATNSDGTVYGGERAFETLAVYGLSITVDGGGSVTPESGEYEQGLEVELTATSDFGWVFARWEGDVAEGGSTDNPVTVLMDSDKSVTAVFERLDYSLEVLIEGEGTVEQQVVSQPTSDYPYETQVELTAVSEFGWRFVEWTGDLPVGIESTDNPLTLTMEGDKSVTAVFERVDYSLEVLIEGEGTVEQQVVSQPTSDYPYETQVELTAQASGGWRFVEWTGDVAGGVSTDNPLTLVMDGDKSVTAVFEEEGWSRDTETEVVNVLNPATGVTWMDRNLGATRAATSRTDSEGYGDLYQWGRGADGHEKRTSSTRSTLSSIDQPGHGDFIRAPSSPYDWRSPRNDGLWQGAEGVNNPCPFGYRLPTQAEWNAERGSWSSNNSVGAYGSPLKLPVAGHRRYYDGSLYDVGWDGDYWSSSVAGTFASFLSFNSVNASVGSYYRARGHSVRCRKD